MPQDKFDYGSDRARKRDARVRGKAHRKRDRNSEAYIDENSINPKTLTAEQALSVVDKWHQLELSSLVNGQDFRVGLDKEPAMFHQCLLTYHKSLCRILSSGREDVDVLIEQQPSYLQRYYQMQRDYLMRATRLALEGVDLSESKFSEPLHEAPGNFRQLAIRYHQEAKKIKGMKRATEVRSYCQRKSDIDKLMLNKMHCYFEKPAKISLNGTIKVQIGFDEIPNDDQYEQNHEALLEEIIDQSKKYHLVCPISHQPFRHPVFAMDGHTYERDAIEAWINRHLTFNLDASQLALPPSPLTRQAMQPILMHADKIQNEINDCIAQRNQEYRALKAKSKIDHDTKKK